MLGIGVHLTPLDAVQLAALWGAQRPALMLRYQEMRSREMPTYIFRPSPITLLLTFDHGLDGFSYLGNGVRRIQVTQVQ